MGIMAVTVGFLVDKCAKLERKLADKSMECEIYKTITTIYEILLDSKATDKTEDKKEA